MKPAENLESLDFNSSEPELVAACCRGNRRAQEIIYKKYVTAMYNRIVRMVPDTFEAEDLLQETFVKVFERLPSFRGEATLGAWIKRIAINNAISHLRKKKHIITEWTDQFSMDIEDPAPLEASLDIRRIHEAVKSLPHGCRTVFVLVAIEGLQHKEVASELSISESTSKSQYRRAKILLGQKLNKHD